MSIGSYMENINPNNGKRRRHDALILAQGEQPRFQYFIDYDARRWFWQAKIQELQRIQSDLGSRYGLPADEGIRFGITNRIESLNLTLALASENHSEVRLNFREYLVSTIENDTAHPKYPEMIELIWGGEVIKRRGQFFLRNSTGQCIIDFR